MNEEIFSIPATITAVNSKPNRSLEVKARTNESLSDDAIARLSVLHEQYGQWVFLPGDRKIDTADILTLPPLKVREEDKMTPAQELRWLMGKWWEQGNKELDFESFYRKQMGILCHLVREKLT